MTQQEQQEVAANCTGEWRAELRSLITGINLVVLVIAVAAGAWGAFDGMTDADGARFGKSLSAFVPSVYVAWCMLESALRRKPSTGCVLLRLFSACLIAPGLAAVPIAAVQAIAVTFPGIRQC